MVHGNHHSRPTTTGKRVGQSGAKGWGRSGFMMYQINRQRTFQNFI
jgi:hypothetical protein